MSRIMLATVNLPGGLAKGSEREVDVDDPLVKEWIEAKYLIPPEGGQRAAAKRQPEEVPSVSQSGMDEGTPGSEVITSAPATSTPVTTTSGTTGTTGSSRTRRA